MMPIKRSTLQLDLKDLSASQSTAGVHHFVLATFTMIALIAVYILINTPSASTANTLEIKSEIANEDLLNTISKNVPEVAAIKNADSNIISILQEKDEEQIDVVPNVEELATIDNTIVNTGEVTNEFSAENNSLENFSLDSQSWIVSKVKKDDTLSQIFNRNDLSSRLAYEISQLKDAKSLLKIRPGQEIKIKKDSAGSLALLQYKLDTFTTLFVKVDGDKFLTDITQHEPEIRLNNAKATIQHSLLGAANTAGVSSNTTYNFVALFGWQVDFAMDLQVGDQFSLIYEELFLDGEKVGNGNIIAAELLVSGKKLQAVRHIDEDGYTNYYAPDGDGIKGTFLRMPLKFGNITSNFSKNRLHPIKNIWRAHTGVDYGAPRGTPVLAAGDGTVRVADREGGYGKTIILRHGGKYDTVYAHLNGYAKGVRTGARVKQGDVIGYVGSTGLATGSHLHYEFRIHGVHKNPVTVTLPKSAPIPEKYKTQFQKTAVIWVAELEYLDRIPLTYNDINQIIN